MSRLLVAMFLWLMFVGNVLGAIDEFGEFTKIAEGDILPSEDKLLMKLVPGYILHTENELQSKYSTYFPELIGFDPDNALVKNFKRYLEKGTTLRGLTFNIYDDDMREAAVALFRLFQSVAGENYQKLKNWADTNVNKEMLLYALRLDALYGKNTPENDLLPPFILNPYYFVNSETIAKAFLIADDLREFGVLDPQKSKVDHYWYLSNFKIDENRYVVIDSNYSGWHKPRNGIEKEINYFREDIALNSYYLGLHLLHPFWMSNDELDEINPRHAEHYYYAHQQLMARYLLEKEHLPNKLFPDLHDESDYEPNLRYKNGLPFPIRSCVQGDWDSEKALIKSIDIAIKECIARGLIIMENGTTINMTDDSHIEVLSRLIRANLDGVKNAKVVRSVFGYGSNRPPIDAYNPAPSLLHHPETSLRDPVYWYLIKYMLNYFTEYKNAMEPYDLTQYETEDIKVNITNVTNITTFFQDYRFPLNHITMHKNKDKDGSPTFLAVRQRRLQHKHFSIDLELESSTNAVVVVRMYLGPQCGSNCWQEYSRFYELDTFLLNLTEGSNSFRYFSPRATKKHSYDSSFDTVYLKPDRKTDDYSIYKFPDNLIIPRGVKEGLKLTLFVMVTPFEKDFFQTHPNNFRRIYNELDSKPFGFPFHRQAKGFKESANNYRFYNVTIYHKRQRPLTYFPWYSPNVY